MNKHFLRACGLALSVSLSTVAHAQTLQTVDFSGAYVKQSGTGNNRLVLDGVRIIGDSTIYEAEYLLGPGYTLSLGPGSRLNPSTLANIESQIRNRTFRGNYSVNGFNFDTSLQIRIAQDGFVAGEMTHAGGATGGVYRGRVAGYLKPVLVQGSPNSGACVPTPPSGGSGTPQPSGGAVFSVATADDVVTLASSNSAQPCQSVILPGGSQGSASSFAFVNAEAAVNADLAAAQRGSPIRHWVLYLKRLDVLQYSNGSIGSWNANREYNLILSLDGRTVTGSVSIPQEIVGGTQTDPQTGNISLTRQ